MMLEAFPTAFIFFAAAILLFALPQGRVRGLLLLAVPLAAGWQIWNLPMGDLVAARLFGFELELMRVDRLSRLFGLIFVLAAFLGNLYAWHLRDPVQQVAALLYAGSAIGVVFAGDLITLFFYWEGTALASVFLIWARRTEGAYHTGMRYLMVQIGSGVILLVGVVLFYRETGSIEFGQMTLTSWATWLIFVSFGIKCAFPLLNNWLTDSYPAATITGTVILSAFTTKMAIYTLARGFPGTEILIPIGVTMALIPMVFALIENDLRRVLAYSMNSQLGFMVVGIGIGSEMALNGAAAHAFASILYQTLLFMCVGAVLFRTGTAKASELGGLYRTMPRTAMFCIAGAASISSVPLFAGFVSKAITVDMAASNQLMWVWIALLIASVGGLFHTGIRIPYRLFFAPDSGLRPKEAPLHMQLAMGISAVLCLLIGIYPEPLYALLPYPVDYQPFTISHVVSQLQLLLFALLAYGVLMRMGVYPLDVRAINLDTDWFYRRFLTLLLMRVSQGVRLVWNGATGWGMRMLNRIIWRLYRSHGPEGHIARVWPTGAMVLWIAILLGVTLVVNFLS